MKLFSKKRKVQSFSRWSSGHSRRSRCCGCLFWIFLSEPTGPFLSPLDWGCSGTVCSSRWAPWGGSTWWSVKNILDHLRCPASLNFNDVDFVATFKFDWLKKKTVNEFLYQRVLDRNFYLLWHPAKEALFSSAVMGSLTPPSCRPCLASRWP